MLVVLPVGTANAAELRFVHAVPGQGPAALEADGKAGDEVSYGQVGEYTQVPDGEVTLKLGDMQQKETLSGGRYTVVAWRKGDRVMLDLFSDGSAKPGQAQVRAIHAAGELGPGDVKLDSETLASSLAPGEASDYKTVDPGDYELRVTRPGGGGAPLAQSQLNLAAGSADTAIVIGSGGQPVDVVVATDDVAAPSQGPATGMGGLADGPPWAAVLLAALAAGALGGAGYRLARRRAA